VEDKEFRDSFNIDMVIRTVSIESGETIVLLDDLHELIKEVPEINPKTNKVTKIKKVTENVQSEIYLSKEDAERFYKLTEHKD
jgi:predicted RND superfamily exporter protein